jgi:hypothetical protein
MRRVKKKPASASFAATVDTMGSSRAAAGGRIANCAPPTDRIHPPVWFGSTRFPLSLPHSCEAVLVQWLKRVAIAITQRIRQQERGDTRFPFPPADAGKSCSFLALHFFVSLLLCQQKVACVEMRQKEADMSSTHVLQELFLT